MALVKHIDGQSLAAIERLKNTSLGCKKQRYREYLQTEYWRRLRGRMFVLAGGRCEECGLSKDDTVLHLHHQCYDRIGKEEESDLRLICEECHERRR